MARLYYQDAELKILDEPTAAIDPVREQQIYQKFLKLYQDTTTIMITHRLGATSLCDWIIAIEDGKAMEQGSHEDLMTKNGIYCEMYETQEEVVSVKKEAFSIPCASCFRWRFMQRRCGLS